MDGCAQGLSVGPAFPDCSAQGVSEKLLAAPDRAFALADRCWLIDPAFCFSGTTSLSLINPCQPGPRVDAFCAAGSALGKAAVRKWTA